MNSWDTDKGFKRFLQRILRWMKTPRIIQVNGDADTPPALRTRSSSVILWSKNSDNLIKSNKKLSKELEIIKEDHLKN